MKKLLLSLFLIFSTTANANEPTDNPDEYRDCVVYTIEEAMENSAPENNILIFTYSDKTTRAFSSNADCATPALVDETPSSPQEGNSGGSNSSSSSSSSSGSSGSSSGGSSSGNSGSSSGNSGSSSGNSSSGNSGSSSSGNSNPSSGGSSSGNNSGEYCDNSYTDGVHSGGCN